MTLLFGDHHLPLPKCPGCDFCVSAQSNADIMEVLTGVLAGRRRFAHDYKHLLLICCPKMGARKLTLTLLLRLQRCFGLPILA